MSGRIIPFPTNAGPPAEDRRAEQRGRCLIQGRILFPDHARTLDVTVRNMGASGALLQGDGLDRLPDHFTLALTARDVARSAELRWANYGKAGVTLRDC